CYSMLARRQWWRRQVVIIGCTSAGRVMEIVVCAGRVVTGRVCIVVGIVVTDRTVANIKSDNITYFNKAQRNL
ncbi:hypothetical protein HQ545_06625, partial [Candidatus Woesearchaeota archaeon]|nr:hypothetical protein [Candidatus Woesearchaeota archaeon]